MKNLLHPQAAQEIIARVNALTPQSPRLWGKMYADQMLAHCVATMEVAVGEKNPPRMFIGRLLGPVVKAMSLSDKPLGKNGPTDKSFIVADRRNFEEEQNRLVTYINRFNAGGAAGCTTHPHSFFGKLTPDEWGVLMYKHLDHHLKQFSA
jgi:hypothetical protein